MIHLRAKTRFCLAAVLVAAAGAGGCTEDPPIRYQVDEAAFETARALRYDYVRQASENLQRIEHTRLVETVQFSADGDTAAAERFILRYDGGRGTMIDSATTGSFSAGLLGRIFGPRTNYTPDTTTFGAIVPDDPVYLSAQNRDSYAFRLTRSGKFPAVEITSRNPGEVESDLQRALLSYDPESRQVIGIELNREDQSWLLESQSEARLSLQKSGLETWLPDVFHVVESRSVPFQRDYRISKTVRYAWGASR